MISLEDAFSLIESSVVRPAAVLRSLDDCLDRVLAEPLAATIDSPPFSKALMDGYAVRSEDVASGRARLRKLEEVTAGRVPTLPLAAGEATQIMTGAPLPEHCDAVVRVEDTRFDPGSGFVEIDGPPVRPGQNMMPRGFSMQVGEPVFAAGHRLKPQDLGMLAELGCPTVPVFPRPSVAVLATGDELVDASEQPGPGQIRNSNQPLLTAQVRRAGADAVSLGVARDDRTDLLEHIRLGLQSDVLLLSGGVSAGTLDLVPSVLTELGVRQIFHKVMVKPGKPVWFGIHEQDGRTACVFGLPGNPVSSLVCFELFVRTALRILMGISPARPFELQVPLVQEHIARGDRPTYYPAELWFDGQSWRVAACNWKGSADLRATVRANAMIAFAAGDRHYDSGTLVPVIPWDTWPGTVDNRLMDQPAEAIRDPSRTLQGRRH